MSNFFSDCRQAFRAMKRNAGSTLLAIVMLGIGIGATTSIFSVFYSVLLQPLPFPQPERLVQVWETRLQHQWNRASFTEANFYDVRARNRTFEDMAIFHPLALNLTGSGDPEQVSAGVVSASFFRVLGVRLPVGRDFLPEEDQPGQENRVALLGNRFWKSHFGADPKIVGTTVRLNDKAFRVVGILPPGEPWLNAADVFIPLVQSPNPDRGSFEFAVIGRLRNGVTRQTALTDLDTICKSLAAQYPKDDEGMGATISPSSEWVADNDLRTKLWLLMAAVAFLLVIACVNLANLLLAKATQRTREIAVRAALGSSRVRIIWMVLAESLILGLSGAIFGVVLALLAINILKSAGPAGIPRIAEMGINPWVLGFTLVTAVLTGVLSGLAPALHAPYKNLVTICAKAIAARPEAAHSAACAPYW